MKLFELERSTEFASENVLGSVQLAVLGLGVTNYNPELLVYCMGYGLRSGTTLPLRGRTFFLAVVRVPGKQGLWGKDLGMQQFQVYGVEGIGYSVLP